MAIAQSTSPFTGQLSRRAIPKLKEIRQHIASQGGQSWILKGFTGFLLVATVLLIFGVITAICLFMVDRDNYVTRMFKGGFFGAPAPRHSHGERSVGGWDAFSRVSNARATPVTPADDPQSAWKASHNMQDFISNAHQGSADSVFAPEHKDAGLKSADSQQSFRMEMRDEGKLFDSDQPDKPSRSRPSQPDPPSKSAKPVREHHSYLRGLKPQTQ